MYRFLVFLANIVIHICFNYHIEGKENLPKDGSYIIACNHRTFWDAAMIACLVKRRCSFIAKSELLEIKVLGKILAYAGAFPVERGAGDTAALDKAVSDIKDGKPFVIFPEGTRTKTGKLGRGKSGVAVIASRCNADLIPLAVCYDGKLRFRKRVTLKVGKLIPYEDFEIKDNDRHQIKAAVKRIMKEIAALLGEEYDA